MSKREFLVIQEIHSGKEIPLLPQATQKIRPVAGGQYRVVDKETGEIVEDLGIGMDGSDLVVFVRETGTTLRLTDFDAGAQSFVVAGAAPDGQVAVEAVTAQQLASLDLGEGESLTAGAGDRGQANWVGAMTLPMLFASGMIAQIIWSSKSKSHGRSGGLEQEKTPSIDVDAPALDDGAVTSKEVFEKGIQLRGTARNAQGAKATAFCNGEPIPGAVSDIQGDHWSLYLSPTQLQGLGLKEGQTLNLQLALQNNLGETLAMSDYLPLPVGHVDPDNRPPVPQPGRESLAIESIAQDNVVDNKEFADGFTVRLTAKNMAVSEGDSVVVSIPGGASVTLKAVNVQANGDFEVIVGKPAIDALGLAQGAKAEIMVTVGGVSATREVSVEAAAPTPKPSLSIVDFAGNDGVDNKEFADGFTVKLKVSNADPSWDRSVVLTGPKGSVTIASSPQPDGSHDVAVSKAAIGQLGLEQGQTAKVTVSAGGAEETREVSVAAAGTPAPTPKPSLSIVDFAGNDGVDNKEFADGFTVKLQLTHPNPSWDGLVVLTGPKGSVKISPSKLPNDGLEVSVGKAEIGQLGLEQGHKCDVKVSAGGAEETREVSVAAAGTPAPTPKPSLSIVDFAGNDGVDNKEFADGFTVKLQLTHPNPSWDGLVVLTGPKGSVKISPSKLPNDGLEVSVGKAEIGQLGLEQGHKCDVKVSAGGAEETREVSVAAAGTPAPTPKPSLSIVDFAGNDGVDNKEFADGFTVKLKVSNPDPSWHGLVVLTGPKSSVMIAPSKLPDGGLEVAVGKAEIGQLGLEQGQTAQVTVVAGGAEATQSVSVAAAGTPAPTPKPSLSIIDFAGNDGVDNKEFADGFTVKLQLTHPNPSWDGLVVLTGPKGSVKISPSKLPNDGLEVGVGKAEIGQLGLEQGHKCDVKVSAGGAEETREVSVEAAASAAPASNELSSEKGGYETIEISKDPNSAPALKLRLKDGETLKAGDEVRLTVNGQPVGSKTANTDTSSLDVDLNHQQLQSALTEDIVSVVKAQVVDADGQVKDIASVPIVRNEKPGETRILKSNYGKFNVQRDLVGTDLIDPVAAGKSLLENRSLTLKGTLGNSAPTDEFAVVVGKAAFAVKAKGGKWALDLSEAQLKSALGTDNLDWQSVDGKTLAVQAFVTDKNGVLKGYAQDSVTLDVAPKVSLDSVAGNNIMTNAEADGNLKVTGLAQNASGMKVRLKASINGQPDVDLGSCDVSGNGKQAWEITLDASQKAALKGQKNIAFKAELIAGSKAIDQAEVTVNPDVGGLDRYIGNDGRVFGTTHDTTFEQAARNWRLIDKHDVLDKTTMLKYPFDGVSRWQAVPNNHMAYADTDNSANGLTALNAFRRFNHTDPVSLTGNHDAVDGAQKGVIAMASQGAISHGLRGFSYTDPDGAEATRQSVIGYAGSRGSSLKGDVSSYVSDNFNGSSGGGTEAQQRTLIGHRLQVLSPGLRETAAAYAEGQNHNSYSAYTTFMGFPSNAIPPGYKLTHDHGAVSRPDTLEWPAAGYFPYALLPNKVWSFQFGDRPIDSRNLNVRVYKNGEEIGVKFATTNETSYELFGTYQNLVCFMPHEKGRKFDGDKNQWEGFSWSNPEAHKGVDRPTGIREAGKPPLDEYTVVISDGKETHAYTVKVFDELQLDGAGGGSSSGAGARSAYSANAADELHAETFGLEATHNRAVVDGNLVEFGSQLDLSGHSDLASSAPRAQDSGAGKLPAGIKFEAESLVHSVVDLSGGDDVATVSGVFAADLRLGGGNDTLNLSALRGGSVDGGDGWDVVRFDSAGNVFDLSRFSRVEAVDLGRTDPDSGLFNIVQLDAAGMKANGGAIELTGQAGNKVALKEGRIESERSFQSEDGRSMHELTYDVNGSDYRIVMSDDLFNGGMGVI